MHVAIAKFGLPRHRTDTLAPCTTITPNIITISSALTSRSEASSMPKDCLSNTLYESEVLELFSTLIYQSLAW
jgi:hypothetical protein